MTSTNVPPENAPLLADLARKPPDLGLVREIVEVPDERDAFRAFEKRQQNGEESRDHIVRRRLGLREGDNLSNAWRQGVSKRFHPGLRDGVAHSEVTTRYGWLHSL